MRALPEHLQYRVCKACVAEVHKSAILLLGRQSDRPQDAGVGCAGARLDGSDGGGWFPSKHKCCYGWLVLDWHSNAACSRTIATILFAPGLRLADGHSLARRSAKPELELAGGLDRHPLHGLLLL